MTNLTQTTSQLCDILLCLIPAKQTSDAIDLLVSSAELNQTDADAYRLVELPLNSQ